MSQRGAPAADGTVYLLHLDPPLKHARHYVGWTSNLDERLEAHRAGRGARLLEAVKEAGGSFHLVRTWAGSRSLERAIKDRKEAPKLCPGCSPSPKPVARGRSAPAAARREPAAAAEAGVVPEPDPQAWLMPFPGRPAGPEVYAEAARLADRLISGWRAELDRTARPPEPDAELELEALPAAGALVSSCPSPNPKEQPMGIWNSSPASTTDPAPPGGWFYDKPLPWVLSPQGEAALDDIEAGAEL